MMEVQVGQSTEKWLREVQDFKGVSHAKHEDLLSHLSSLEFPNSRMEEWKYTRTQRLNQLNLTLGKSLIISDPEFESLNNVDSVAEGGFFRILNHSAITEAFSLRIPENENFDEPFQMVLKVNGNSKWTQPFIDIQVAKNAKASVVLHFIGEGVGFCNAFVRVNAADGADIAIDVIQDNSDDFFQILDIVVEEGSRTVCAVNTHVLNGGWIRNNLRMSLNGEFSHAGLAGFYLPRNGQLIDNHTVVDHRVPNCTSDEMYKGVLYDKARGVFNGKVYVRKDAQKTQAYQSNKNIMMSDAAVMDSKPELEIYADDVRCSHGSTTGQFDEEALFYLRARGLSEEGAKGLLVSAYVNEVIEKSKNPTVIEYVKRELAQRGLIVSDEV